MGKDLLIKQAVKELKKDNSITLFDEPSQYEEEAYRKVDLWNDILPYFNQLNNIINFSSYSLNWQGNIYSSLRELKNLVQLEFNNSDLSKTEEYLNNGLEKFPELEVLVLARTNLKNTPKFLRPLFSKNKFSKLKSLGLIGNRFYKQNFHFQLTSNSSNIYDRIKTFFDYKKKELASNIQKDAVSSIKNLNQVSFNKFDWGLQSIDGSILILQDSYINIGIHSLSIYVLNENKQDKYDLFNTYYNLFKELNEKEHFIHTVSKGKDLDLFFYNENDIYDEIYLRKLKELQKAGETKYQNYFISDLLTYLGGEQLIIDISNEQQELEKDFSENFYLNNDLIQNIEIKNFKAIEKQELTELGKINIVVGKNGAGKTSLLQAIAASLTPYNSSDFKDYSNYINIALKDKPNNLFFARTHAKWENFEKAQRIFRNDIELETINKEQLELPASYLVLAYGENLYAKKHPFKEFNSDYQDVLVNGMYKWYHTESIFTTSYEFMANPLDLLYELSEGRLKQEHQVLKEEIKEIAEIISNKLNVFLEKASAQKFRIKLDGAFYKFFNVETKQFIDFNQISEGYRSYIILLTDIVMRIIAARKRLLINGFELHEIFKKVKGAIIIDEFDKHMHPSWQRTFLRTLKEEFPLIQFFLSTHNIVSLQSAEGEKVFVISEENGKIEIKDEKIPLGYSIEALYDHYFDENFYSQNITDKLLKFKFFGKEMRKNKDFTLMNDDDFIKRSNELSKINTQLATIVDMELFQLNKLKKNAETK